MPPIRAGAQSADSSNSERKSSSFLFAIGCNLGIGYVQRSIALVDQPFGRKAETVPVKGVPRHADGCEWC